VWRQFEAFAEMDFKSAITVVSYRHEKDIWHSHTTGDSVMKRILLTAVAVAVTSTHIAISADWPQWRGPHRDGISQESGLLGEWPADGPKLLWRIDDAESGYGTPAVVGDRFYITCNKGMDDEFVRDYAVVDGAQIWSTRIGKVGNPDQQPPFAAARSTPTVDGGQVYVLGSDGDLARVDAATGKIAWTKNVRSEFGGKPGTWAYSESPLVDGDVLVCSPGGPDATLVALDKRTGNVIWKCPVPEADDAGYSSAIVVNAAGRKQYIQFLSKGVVGVDAETGKFLWRYDGTGKGPANAPTPVAHENLVYTAAGRVGGGLVELKNSGDGITAEQVYMERGLPFSLGGSVLVDGYLYGTTNEGLVCANFAKGDTKWKEKSVGTGSLCYAGGRLYIHGDDDQVVLVEPSPDEYREKGRFKLPNQPEHTRGPMEKAWTYPVVASGRLYIRDLGTIWCYEVKQP
jgi:outer membrane protein assembly factor BamB